MGGSSFGLMGLYLMMRMFWDSFRVRFRSGWLLWYRLRELCYAERRRGRVSIVELGERGFVFLGRKGFFFVVL